MEQIDILMATYNGASYVEGQIYSLLCQTHKNWRLFVHDDGSTDITLNLVKEIAANDSRIVVVEDGLKFGNAGSNFMHLLSFSTNDYIIFCDQDDFWLETKLEVLCSKIKKMDDSKAVGVYSSGFLYSKQYGITAPIATGYPKKIEDVLFLNAGVQGCAVMFNGKCRDLMLSYSGHISMHDHLLTMVLTILGEIDYIDTKLMLYRQFHESKVTNNIEVNVFKRIFKQIFSSISVLDFNHYCLIKDFYSNFESDLTNEQKKKYSIFNELFTVKTSIVVRLLKIYSGGFTISNSRLKLLIKVIMRPLLS